MVEYTFSCAGCHKELARVTTFEDQVFHTISSRAKLKRIELNCLDCGRPNKFQFNPILEFNYYDS
jgi:hypothetical protein